MRSLSIVVAVGLALSGGAVLAQAGPSDDPGATSTPRPQAARSSSPAVEREQAMGMHRDVSVGINDDPRAVAITDEYGTRYNSRGEPIGRERPDR